MKSKSTTDRLTDVAFSHGKYGIIKCLIHYACFKEPEVSTHICRSGILGQLLSYRCKILTVLNAFQGILGSSFSLTLRGLISTLFYRQQNVTCLTLFRHDIAILMLLIITEQIIFRCLQRLRNVANIEIDIFYLSPLRRHELPWVSVIISRDLIITDGNLIFNEICWNSQIADIPLLQTQLHDIFKFSRSCKLGTTNRFGDLLSDNGLTYLFIETGRRHSLR